MTTLKFTIRVFLEHDNEPNEISVKSEGLKQCLRDCNAKIQIWNIYNFDPSTISSKPSFGNLIFEVYCEVFIERNHDVHITAQYKHFIREWNANVHRHFQDHNIPLLHFNDNKAYCYSTKNAHRNVGLEEVSFGTLVTSTCYVKHFVPGYDTPKENDAVPTIPELDRDNDDNDDNGRFFEEHELDYQDYDDYNTFFDEDELDYQDYDDYYTFFDEDFLDGIEKKVLTNAEFLHDNSELTINFIISHHYEDWLEDLEVFDDSLKLNYGSIKQIIVGTDNTVVIELLNSPTIYCGDKRFVETKMLPKIIVGRSNAIALRFSKQDEFEEIISRLHFKCKRNGAPVYYCSFQTKNESIPSIKSGLSYPILSQMEFSCLYLIEALIRRNCKLQLQNFQEFVQVVSQNLLLNSEITEEALSDLVRLTDTGHSFNLQSSFKILYEWHQRLSVNSNDLFRDSEKMAKIRRAIITPTRILLWPPEICIQNRIIRNFDKEHALRVSFRDEDYFKLNYRHSSSNVVINETVRPNLLEGINIGGRHFEFLAWSNSQIRDHGVWLYSTDGRGKSASSIREWMGDFSNIFCVPKYMARMGQCFSQTQDSGRRIDFRRYIIDNDIERGYDRESRKPYCFSDGVGRISVPVAQEIITRLNIPGNPSAFQIRFGGCKGMLVKDPTLKMYDIVFRRSMNKFPCASSQSLEICKFSSPLGVSLNRPMINILNQNGIPNYVFLRLQEDALEELTDMFFDDEKAARYMQSHQNLNLDFVNLVGSVICPTVEPFLRGMLLASHLTAVEKILKKTNIPINMSDGRNMFGVLDETATLNYGEVFVQYTENYGGTKTKILEGEVVVTKNPCHQRGDVRVLIARNVQALHHIKDCIVFPQNGHRPHPNEMAGSDLDGDEYVVIWKQDLNFHHNKTPFDVPVAKNTLLSRPVQISDMIDFLCKYIGSDNIGRIANAHLAFSDLHGIDSQICANLARKCSIAVDFPKNGEEVKLDREENPEIFPHFMQRPYKKMYKSRRALGVLFSKCQKFCEYTCETSETYSNVQYDKLLEYPGWKNYEKSAIESRDKYNNRLDTILMTYGIKNESEAMTNCFSRLHGRFNFHKDRSEIEELIKLSIEELVKIMRKDFFQEFSNRRDFDDKRMLSKASAWYMVTYSRSDSPKFLSFPWIVHDQLCLIKNYNMSIMKKSEKPAQISPVLLEFSNKLRRVRPQLPNLMENHIINLETVVTSECPLKEWILAAQMLIEFVYYTRINYLNRVCSLDESKTVKLLIYTYQKRQSKITNAMQLILNFLKHFMPYQFKEHEMLSKVEELRKHTTVDLKNIHVLAKECLITYRHLAITGTFDRFGTFSDIVESELIELEPPYNLPINAKGNHSIHFLKSKLLLWSGCAEIQIREERYRGIIVTAFGEKREISKLRTILNKGPESIVKALDSGGVL